MTRSVEGVLVVAAVTTFSIMFSIAVVGPLLGELADAESIPLGSAPNTTIGVIFSLGGLTLALAQVPVALAADRYGRRRFIFLGSLVVAVSVAGIGYAGSLAELLGLRGLSLPLGWDGSTLLLALLRVIQGLGAAATWPIMMALLSVIVPEELLGTAMGVFGASFGLGMSLGPVLGPALATMDIHLPFTVAGILGVVAAGSALLLPEARARVVRRRRRRILIAPDLLALSIVAFTLLYTMASLVVIYPRYMIKMLGLGMSDVAIAMAFAGLTYTLLQPATGKLADKLDKKLLIVPGLPVAGISALAAIVSASPALVYMSMLFFGLAGALVFPAASSLVGIRAPEGMEGAYMGFYNAMLSLGVTVSPIIVGLLSDTLGYLIAFSTPLILSAIAAAMVALSV
ncbi:MAG: MFS transporter [Pyrodictiaceae archaeon]